MRLGRIGVVLLVFYASVIFAQNLPTVNMQDLPVRRLNEKALFVRSIYTLETNFSSHDTLLFLSKVPHLKILRVDSVAVHELRCQILVDSGFVDFGNHKLVVMDNGLKRKVYVSLNVRYQNAPVVQQVVVEQYGRTNRDTVILAGYGRTFASLMIKGKGFFRTSRIEFDDAKIRVLDNPSWRIDYPPDSLRVGLEIDRQGIQIGRKTFRVKNEYALEGFGEIVVRSDRPPKIINRIYSFVADGKEKELTLLGENFYKGIRGSILPPNGFITVNYESSSRVKVLLNIPILESSQSYRIVLTNPDGQSDTTAYFTVKNPPLSRAWVRRVEGGEIFLDKTTRVVLAVETLGKRRLSARKSWEINIEGERFPITNVINDSLCEAVIKVPSDPSRALLNQYVFTINEVGRSAWWKGMLKTRPAPQITYMSENRILHPSDTLELILKGKNFDNASLNIEDPEVNFHIIERRDDLVRVRAVAGAEVSPGSYPLRLRIDKVTFTFDRYKIVVQPWQAFSDYVGIETTSLGFLTPQKLWKGSGIAHPIERNDAITIKIFTNRIRADLGEQKFFITGVLMDSTNTIRAEAMNKKMIVASKGQDIISWQWRVRERLQSGDRIELTLSNPGDANKSTEIFYVKRHWSENFHGSTSFILFKIPFGGGNATTEILRSASIGISYQPYYDKKFIAFDASFIIGNVASGNDNLSVDVGLGLSVILWQHIQIGIGTKLTGSSEAGTFSFVGTRFKLPFPLK